MKNWSLAAFPKRNPRKTPIYEAINPLTTSGLVGTSVSFTLPETNIAPENRVSQKESSIPTIHFQGVR